MAVLGLRFCARAFSSCGKRGPLFIAVRGPLTVAASLVAEQRLQTRRLSNLWLTGLVTPWHAGSSQTRARTHVPCIGRQILNHCATREAPKFLNFILFILLNSRFLLFISFIHMTVYMSVPISQFITPPSPTPSEASPAWCPYVGSLHLSQLLRCKPVHLYHFSTFHIHALTYDICFSLSDLLHSV